MTKQVSETITAHAHSAYLPQCMYLYSMGPMHHSASCDSVQCNTSRKELLLTFNCAGEIFMDLRNELQQEVQPTERKSCADT